jgi:aminoglycoside phosphotransferase (APT) family kinase protein
MNETPRTPPSSQKAQNLLDRFAPGTTVTAIHPLVGSYSNLTHLVEACDDHGHIKEFVVRSYIYGKRAVKARVEFNALKYLKQAGVPAPKPIYLDVEGQILGSPGIVMSYVPGVLIEDPSQHPVSNLTWSNELGMTLAKIHSVDCSSHQDIFLNADDEATWFLRGDQIPDYMRKHILGITVWKTIKEYRQYLRPVDPTLVHIDYWRGNVIWQDGRISAVVDWEEAGYGDPAIDVGYCLMELVIMGMTTEAATFLKKYQALRGPVRNLFFWALAATARPMYSMESWITENAKAVRFEKFIRHAIQQLTK